ncbi:hypothetical protein [Escherichia coli]|nr:hypothetical protein [Escherichia coli]MCW7261255.1 hypothetical protein [Escherichia coli]
MVVINELITRTVRGISFLVMLVAIFFSTAWRVLTLSGLVG